MAVLDSRFARKWWRSLMGNVVGLIVDAHLLFDHASYGRAQALGILAAEELGKAWILYSAAEISWADGLPEVEIPGDFEQQARSHVTKLGHAASYGEGGSMMWDVWFAGRISEVKTEAERASLSRKYNLLKQAGFYVDRQGDEVSSPADVPANGVAAMLSETARAAHMLLVEDHVRMQNSGEDPDWMHSVWEPLVPFGKGFAKPARILSDES